jgi:hypothetical protein
MQRIANKRLYTDDQLKQQQYSHPRRYTPTSLIFFYGNQ